MKTSSSGIELIKSFEGFRSDAYKDAVGIPTIGYGTTIVNGVPVKLGTSVTEEEATELLSKDVEKFEAKVDHLVTVPLSQKMFDALICFCYNVGPANLASSTLLKLLNAKDYDKVPAQFLRWSKAKGKVLPGLVRRRRAEAELFRNGITDL